MPVDVGSPFGSPISLAPLIFSKHERQLWNSLPPRYGDPGAIDDRAPDLQPRGFRGQPPGDTPDTAPSGKGPDPSRPAGDCRADRSDVVTCLSRCVFWRGFAGSCR